MNLKLINTKTAAFVLALMMIDSGSALAGTVVLSGVTSNTCSSYTGFNVDANGNLTVTCADTGSAPTQAPSCTLIASPATINLGSSTTLIASCSPAATSFAWTGINFTGSGGSVNPASTTSYSVSGTNSFGTGEIAPVVVTVLPAGTGGGSTPGTRTVPPTSRSSPVDIRVWNAAFAKLNNIPYNPKTEPLGTMDYFKQMQAGKNTQYHLPNPW